MSVYLDFNASTPIDECVLDYMIEIYRTSYGNADSRTHTFGDAARQVVEIARKRVASILSVKTDEVFLQVGLRKVIISRYKDLKSMPCKRERNIL